MVDKSEKKRRKGTFTPLRLPFNKGYIFPISRRNMIVAGGLMSLAVLTYFFIDELFQRSDFITRGPVSSNHANFEKDCRQCHDVGFGITDDNCKHCHEKTSEFSIYDFTSHYIYRSRDLTRISQDTLEKYAGREMLCGHCHTEHLGRSATITRVSDSKCINCHKYDSFDDNHPEFEFAQPVAPLSIASMKANTVPPMDRASFTSPDDSTLIMTHNRHTLFILRKLTQIIPLDSLFQSLKESTKDSVFFFESACLYCHVPEPDGKNFVNIDFDQHCGARGCHIGPDRAVEYLPVLDLKNPNEPGVESIEMIRKRGGPGIAWAFTVNPNQVLVEDSEASKTAVFHKDPWIMENLKQIRKKLFMGDGLFELLKTSSGVPRTRIDTLYSEALHTLRNYTNEFRGRVELREELAKIDSLLRISRKRLDMPDDSRSAFAFQFPFETPNDKLSEEQRSGFMQLALDLTDAKGPECQKCHFVENATILRVQADQNVLIRAEFDHRAHILEKRCTECHIDITISEQTLRTSVDNQEEFEKNFPEDQAARQNIPKLHSCQECHAEGKVSNSCVTCHKFHANKENRSNLQLFANE